MDTPLTGSINSEEPPKDPRIAAGFPGLDQQVLISWVFIQASVCLLSGFILLQWGIHYPLSYFAMWPNVGNMVFMASCLGWFLGFVLLTHWTVYAIGDTGSLGLLGTLFKLVAAVFFNMQPMSAMWEEDAAGTTNSEGGFMPGVSFGFGWSNFLGIWCARLCPRLRVRDRPTAHIHPLLLSLRSLFHTGNVFSVYAMMKPANGLFDYGNKFSHGNLPVWGMWTYLLATTFLVTANGACNLTQTFATRRMGAFWADFRWTLAQHWRTSPTRGLLRTSMAWRGRALRPVRLLDRHCCSLGA